MATRLKPLARAMLSAGPGNPAIYTVPANVRTLVRNLLITNTDGAGTNAFVQLESAGAVTALIFSNSAMAAGFFSQTDLYAMMLTGDTINVGVVSGSISVWISGSELIGP